MAVLCTTAHVFSLILLREVPNRKTPSRILPTNFKPPACPAGSPALSATPTRLCDQVVCKKGMNNTFGVEHAHDVLCWREYRLGRQPCLILESENTAGSSLECRFVSSYLSV